MPRRQPPDPNILDLVRDQDWDTVVAKLVDLHPADIADIIDHAPYHLHEQVFALLDDKVKPEVVAELTIAGSEVMESLTNLEISDIMEELAPDDAADILAELPEERSEQVLDLMEEDDSEDVRELMKYDDDTAGGIMTTDVVSMHENQTVAEAIQAIAYLDTQETFLYAHIVDEQDVMIGYVNIWELLRERNKERKLGELAHRNFIAAAVNMDQENVARLASKYDLAVIPVVDLFGRLVGRITADDVLDVMEEEASEDIFRLAGSDDAELERLSPVRSCFIRLPWLLITLCGGFVTSFILSRFLHLPVSDIIVLAPFAPVVLAMGGNAGIQSSTLVVRSIALGSLAGRSMFRFLLREALVGALMGALCGVMIAIGANVMIAANPAYAPVFPPSYLAMVVAIALFIAMTFATVFGTAVPIVLSKVNVDPAVAAGPFITIMNDILALVIFFAVALFLLVPGA